MSRNTGLAPHPPNNRGKVANGTALFVAPVDGRTKEARRFRDILAGIVSDMGGVNVLSEGQQQLARRAALMSVQCEVMEGKSVAGDQIDLEQFGRLTDRLGRAFHRLGLKRIPRDVSLNPLAEHFSRPPERRAAG